MLVSFVDYLDQQRQRQAAQGVAWIGADESSGEQAYLSEEAMAQSMQHPMQPIADAIGLSNQQMTLALSELVNTINENQNRPKQVVRGQDGKIIGVQ